MSEQTKAEIEALQELQQSKGWHLFREAVIAEVADAFEEHITRALNVPDGPIALDRARQVAAIRVAAMRWLKWPSERVNALASQLDVEAHAMSPAGRRGSL